MWTRSEWAGFHLLVLVLVAHQRWEPAELLLLPGIGSAALLDRGAALLDGYAILPDGRAVLHGAATHHNGLLLHHVGAARQASTAAGLAATAAAGALATAAAGLLAHLGTADGLLAWVTAGLLARVTAGLLAWVAADGLLAWAAADGLLAWVAADSLLARLAAAHRFALHDGAASGRAHVICSVVKAGRSKDLKHIVLSDTTQLSNYIGVFCFGVQMLLFRSMGDSHITHRFVSLSWVAEKSPYKNHLALSQRHLCIFCTILGTNFPVLIREDRYLNFHPKKIIFNCALFTIFCNKK